MCGMNRKNITENSDGNFFRVTFRSNDVYDATGFKGLYEFKEN